MLNLITLCMEFINIFANIKNKDEWDSLLNSNY